MPRRLHGRGREGFGRLRVLLDGEERRERDGKRKDDVRSLGVRGGRARTGCVGVISLDGDEFFTAMLTATLSRSARTMTAP